MTAHTAVWLAYITVSDVSKAARSLPDIALMGDEVEAIHPESYTIVRYRLFEQYYRILSSRLHAEYNRPYTHKHNYNHQDDDYSPDLFCHKHLIYNLYFEQSQLTLLLTDGVAFRSCWIF